MDKKEVFQQAILPVLKTCCQMNGRELGELIQDMVNAFVQTHQPN
jgi:hypothetical protein